MGKDQWDAFIDFIIDEVLTEKQKVEEKSDTDGGSRERSTNQ